MHGTKTVQFNDLNFEEEICQDFIDKIVKHTDLQGERSRIKNELERGGDLKERFKEAKRKSAGQLFKCGGSRLNKDVFDVVKENVDRRKMEDQKKRRKGREEMKRKKAQVRQIRDTKVKETFTISDLRTLVNYKRQKNDPPLPTRKKDLCELYSQYYEGPGARASPECSPESSDNEDVAIGSGSNEDDAGDSCAVANL